MQRKKHVFRLFQLTELSPYFLNTDLIHNGCEPLTYEYLQMFNKNLNGKLSVIGKSYLFGGAS